MRQPIDSNQAVLDHPNMQATRLCKPCLLLVTLSAGFQQVCSYVTSLNINP